MPSKIWRGVQHSIRELKGDIMSLHNVKAVVFDMDGVIFDTENIICALWEETGKELGLLDINQVILKCIGTNAQMTEAIVKEHYGQDFDYKGIKRGITDTFLERYSEGRLPMKIGVVDTLTYLKSKGYRIGLATSTRQEIVLNEIKDAGLLKYFDEIVCGDMVSRSKPDPEIFLTACERLGVDPKEAVGIEDSYNGIKALHAAGMIPIMVPDILKPTDEIKALTYTICENLIKVQELL